MNSEARAYLQRHIQVKLEKDPEATPKEVMEWLLSGHQTFDLSLVNYKTLHSFITRNMKKYKETGSMDMLKGRGAKKTKLTRGVINKIKRLSINRKRRGTRSVAAMVGVSKSSVHRTLKESGAKFYHMRKVQVMQPHHEEARVQFAHWALDQYGGLVNGNTVWGRLINTDFSAMVKKNGTLNTRVDGVWSKSMDSAGDLLDFQQEKFGDSFMIWGGISAKGLIPSTAPVFVSDLKEEWGRMGYTVPRGVTGDMYAYMVTTKAVPAVQALYGQRAVWQDDPATIHRTANALEACQAFKHRVPHQEQAAKMADIWPIENVWAIVKQRVKEKEPKSKQHLKRVIISVWKEVDQDKALCKRLISSVPRRLEAVIALEGKQVRKSDYRANDIEE